MFFSCVFMAHKWNRDRVRWGKKKSRNEDIRSEEHMKKSWLFSDRMWRKIEIDAHNGGDVVVREFSKKI